MTREEIKKLVAEDPGYAVAAMLEINQYQTADEQREGCTKYENQMGFNGCDAPFFADLIEFYRRTGFLTPGQLAAVRRHLPKYFGQIAGATLEPAPFKIMERKPVEKQPKQVKLEGDKLVITFPYDPATVGQVRTLPTRYWDSNRKCWTAPVVPSTVKLLAEWGFEIDPQVTRVINDAVVAADKVDRDLVDNTLKLRNGTIGLKKELRQYQKEGVAFVESKKGRALIADEMGLGKTAQAIAYAQLHPELRPVLIVCPATVKLHWQRQVAEWMTLRNKTHIIEGRPLRVNESLPEADIYIVNYDIMAVSTITPGKKSATISCRDDILRLKPQLMIVDEVHYVQNRDTARTKVFTQLAKIIPYLICLSGTPITNRPVGFYPTISAINPKLFPRFMEFAQKYCGAVYNGFGWDFNGSTNSQELHEILSNTVMVRRKKADVLKDLPPKVRTVEPVEINNRKEYQRAETDFVGWLRGVKGDLKVSAALRAEALVKIGELKRLAVVGKLDSCISWIEDFLDSGEKLVVFAVHQFVIEALMKHFKGIAVKLDGSTSMPDRQKAVDSFQENPAIKLFVGNVKAAGIGITLTAASSTCTLELEWTPGVHDQAEDRVHRIGQEADSVNAYYLLSEGTMEEQIAALIDSKREVLAKVLDGQEVQAESMLMELLKTYGDQRR